MPSSGKASNSRALSDNVAFLTQKLTNKFHSEKIKCNWESKEGEEKETWIWTIREEEVYFRASESS